MNEDVRSGIGASIPVPITKSGLYGERVTDAYPLLITQGLKGYKLVAGKQFLVRLFLPDLDTLPLVTGMVVIIDSPMGAGRATALVPREQLLKEAAEYKDEPRLPNGVVNLNPHGTSIGLIIKGCAVPKGGTYKLTVSAWTQQGMLAEKEVPLHFTDCFDLRLLVQRAVIADEPNPLFGAPGYDPLIHPRFTRTLVPMIEAAIVRAAAQLPVRDGVGYVQDFERPQDEAPSSRTTGIRWSFSRVPVDAARLGARLLPASFQEEANRINGNVRASNVPGDLIDVAIVFMPLTPAMNMHQDAVKAGHGDPYWDSNVPGGIGVLGLFTPLDFIFDHELGHVLSLEPENNSPPDGISYADSVGHAATPRADKEPRHTDLYGFDFALQRPFRNGPRYGVNNMIYDPVLVDYMSADLPEGVPLEGQGAHSFVSWNFALANPAPTQKGQRGFGTADNPATTCSPELQKLSLEKRSGSRASVPMRFLGGWPQELVSYLQLNGCTLADFGSPDHSPSIVVPSKGKHWCARSRFDVQFSSQSCPSVGVEPYIVDVSREGHAALIPGKHLEADASSLSKSPSNVSIQSDGHLIVRPPTDARINTLSDLQRADDGQPSVGVTILSRSDS